ncbi:MAG: hypothetical protein EA361_04525 [Bacteroidetes bacterium]|nr:MAG: hypothetical protein EA361_04525 [Bacteroidota bacterium]
MTHSQILKIISHILVKEMRGFQSSDSSTASFEFDFLLSPWEINWLLCIVEERFHVELERGMEDNLSNINQLVNIVHARINPVLVKDYCLT